MKAIIKKETILKFMDEHNMTKNKFSDFCGIAVKTFDGLWAEQRLNLLLVSKLLVTQKLNIKICLKFNPFSAIIKA